MDAQVKPLSPAEITFRRQTKTAHGQAVLLPMVDGIDIPNFQSAVINQTLQGAVMVMTVLLPRGVVVE